MPFSRPTLTEIVTRTEADLASRLGTGPLLENSVLKVLARAVAGGHHLEHGHIDYVSRQVIWDSAELEFLERWVDIWGFSRLAATFAQGLVDFTGTEGTSIPPGTKVKRADGLEYATDAGAIISAGAASIACTATVSGVAWNTDAATPLSLSSPIAGIDPTATVGTLGLGAGADEETDAGLLARFLVERRQPPTGGSNTDYTGWALEIAGVTRAWCLPEHQGAGTVGIPFMVDGNADPFPDPATVAVVQAKIDLERPVTAKNSLAFAPFDTPLEVSMEILPNTPAVQASVTTALEELILREAAPGKTLLISKIREAISTAAGELNHVLTVPGADVTVAAGELTTLGTVTFADIS